MLSIADTKFQNQATRVLNKDAAEVDDVSVVRDNDHLYVISEDQALHEPQGGSVCSSIVLHIGPLIFSILGFPFNLICRRDGISL